MGLDDQCSSQRERERVGALGLSAKKVGTFTQAWDGVNKETKEPLIELRQMMIKIPRWLTNSCMSHNDEKAINRQY